MSNSTPSPAAPQDRYDDPAYMAAANSPANRQVKAMMERAEQLRDDLRDWLEAHAEGCCCDWCDFDPENSEEVHAELSGLHWALRAIVSNLQINGWLHMSTREDLLAKIAEIEAGQADEPAVK
jgi:hypothetical protein